MPTTRTLLLLVGGLLSTGCKFELGAPKETEAASNTERSESDDTKKTKRKKKTDPSANEADGRFVYKFTRAKTPALTRYEALFQHGRLESLVNVMGVIKLPRDVPVTVAECGQPNAFYSSKQHALVMCYELAHTFYQKFEGGGVDDQQASDRTLNALTFVLLHEMGHAIIGEADLGVTGGEEDAVDDLAALLLIDAKQPQWAIDGAISMAFLGQGAKPVYFDEHSLGEQRFYNITCTVFGSDPDKFASLVHKQVLPERRAVRCPTEYQRKDKAWTAMLKPHVRHK